MKDESSIFDAEPENLDRLVFEILGEPEAEEGSGDAATVDGIIEQPGGQIGRYKLLNVLGEGGMGIVYLAEQQEPIRRKVALKVIKPGMDSKRVIARFEAERQALALLDHPNIAHVYDAGTTEAGRPYFVMEYVKGLSITEHCDRQKLTIEDRLGLFRQVCLAVHHAHQKGIIHRDIKPSNILVSLQDDQAVPKIIDFGVAKALAQPLTERTLATEDSQLLGTPEYMSPEQADMASVDIDTRSDIYSLGVLLYVLLTGVLPFDSTTFREGGIEHIRQIIRETDPKTPSTRLSSLGEEAKKVAQSRRIEIASLAKKLHKELEWIPLKAMRKERSERYRSASELADDIENYLNGDPLIAGPLTAVYRLRKFVRRNRGLVAAVAAILIVLIAGIVVSTIFAIGQASARAEAERQAKISKAVSDFLREDLLASVSPTKAKGREVTVRSFLDMAGENLDGRFKNEPLVEASIRDTLGNTYRHLGDFSAAELHLERACHLHQGQLGLADRRTLNSMSGLFWVYLSQGRYLKGEQLAEKRLEISHRMFREGQKNLVEPTKDVAFAYMKTGRYQESELIYGKLLEISRSVSGDENGQVSGLLSGLARLYSKQGRYNEAEQLYKKVLGPNLHTLSDEHPFRLVTMNIVARVYGGQGRYAEAEDLCLRTLEAHRRVVGEEHLYTLECISELVCIYIAQGHYREAEGPLNKALEIARRRLGEGHPLTLRFVNGLAVVHTNLKHFDEAETLLDEALKGRQRELGEDHPDTLESKNDLAVLYKEQERYDQAESLLLEAVEGRRLKLGDTHPHTLESLNNLIALYEAWNKPEKAEEWRAKSQGKN